MTEELTKESSACYRRAPTEEGGEGTPYRLHDADMWVRLPVLIRQASSRSLEEVSRDSVSQAHFAWEAAVAQGHEPLELAFPKPTDEERARYRITGRVRTSISFGAISTEGVQDRLTAVPLPWCELEVGDPKASHIVYRRPNGQGSLGSFFVVLFATAERMEWLFDQLDRRPGASLLIWVEFKAFIDDEFGWEPQYEKPHYLEPDKPHEVTDFGLHVQEEEVRDKAEPKVEEPQAKALEPIPPAPATAPSEALLKQMVRGLGWLIALQALILVVLVVLRR